MSLSGPMTTLSFCYSSLSTIPETVATRHSFWLAKHSFPFCACATCVLAERSALCSLSSESQRRAPEIQWLDAPSTRSRPAGATSLSARARFQEARP
eukprot:6210785-Pleurochrysis_carterae.AAC.7